jgi:hypothetical protein
MTNFKREDTTQILVRLPTDVLAWLEKEAIRMVASRNSEVVRSVRLRMDAAEQQSRRRAKCPRNAPIRRRRPRYVPRLANLQARRH